MEEEYAIYKSPTGAIEAVKKGWSWPGFFFPWVWAFVKGLYPIAIIALIVELPSVIIHPIAGSLAFIVVAVVVGSKGNEMRQDNLLKRGFQFICKISALTPEGALALFAQEQNTQVAQVPDYMQKPQPTEVFSNLIDCPDCKKSISRKAVACPGCGCPIASAMI